MINQFCADEIKNKSKKDCKLSGIYIKTKSKITFSFHSPKTIHVSFSLPPRGHKVAVCGPHKDVCLA